MDYDTQIDKDTWDFIHRTAACYPADTAERSIQEQRDIYNAMAAVFLAPRPSSVETEDRQANGVPVRVYSAGSPTRTVLFCHGGGFVVGGLESHDDVCAEICAQTGYRVVAVDYRLAPEHKHPSMFQDAWNALRWAIETFEDRIVLAGDSAGGNLVAALAHNARDTDPDIAGQLLGQVLVYPGLGGDVSNGSYVEHANAPMLTRDEILFYMNIRADGDSPTGDATYAPLHDSNFADLPPTVLVSADCDPVRDDSATYRDHILAAGGKAVWINEEGLVHGYLRARHSVARAQDSFERITIAIEALGQELWPYAEN